MAFGDDDGDRDDEYSDQQERLFDTTNRTIIQTGALPRGFKAFTQDGARMLASSGSSNPTPPSFSLWDARTGGASIGTVSTGPLRATQPERSADDSLVAFVVPSTYLGGNGLSSPTGDDDHFAGGSLFAMSYVAATGGYGPPVALVSSAGENNYAPAFSPDRGRVLQSERPGRLPRPCRRRPGGRRAPERRWIEHKLLATLCSGRRQLQGP
jgi:hypothetical protein